MESFTSVESRVLVLLATAITDFRTEESMAEVLRIQVYTLGKALKSLETRSLVRRPVLATDAEQSYWRLTNRGLTSGEKLRQVKTTISRG